MRRATAPPIRLLVMAAIVLALAACGGSGYLITADPPATHTDLVFADEFEGATLDLEKWDTTWWVGPVFHTEIAWFTDDAIDVNDGTLTITASNEPATSKNDPGDTRAYSTGQVATQQAFDRGTFEIRLRHGAGANLAQAVWLLPYPYQWPPEIDIMETRLSVDPRTVYLNVHSGTEETLVSEPTYVILDDPLDEAWHTYRLTWEGPNLAWYIDDELVRSQVAPVSDVPMRLLLDQTWILPWSGGAPITSELPVALEVDYVRVWQ